jgi:hypothetical protein
LIDGLVNKFVAVGGGTLDGHKNVIHPHLSGIETYRIDHRIGGSGYGGKPDAI